MRRCELVSSSREESNIKMFSSKSITLKETDEQWCKRMEGVETKQDPPTSMEKNRIMNKYHKRITTSERIFSILYALEKERIMGVTRRHILSFLPPPEVVTIKKRNTRRYTYCNICRRRVRGGRKNVEQHKKSSSHALCIQKTPSMIVDISLHDWKNLSERKKIEDYTFHNITYNIIVPRTLSEVRRSMFGEYLYRIRITMPKTVKSK